jgi:hypothetical protein
MSLAGTVLEGFCGTSGSQEGHATATIIRNQEEAISTGDVFRDTLINIADI